MTLMLASVSGPQEAEIAIAHGADIIDLRAADGAFAAVSADVVRATVAAVKGRRPVSAIVGHAEENPTALVAAVTALAEAGGGYGPGGVFSPPPPAGGICAPPPPCPPRQTL